MEVSRRGITRWRLARWCTGALVQQFGHRYAACGLRHPSGMRRMELEPGQAALQIKFEIVATERETYDKTPEAPGRVVNRLFRRQGQRLFATEKTRAQLQEIGDIKGKMLE